MKLKKEKMIEINIPGKPVPMARPRVVKRGRYVHTYNPPKMMNWEHYAHHCGIKAMRENHWKMIKDNPIDVEVWIHRPIPKSWPKKKKFYAKRYLIAPTTKPDIDNYVKSAIDSQIGVAYYDDNLITSLSADEFYSSKPHLMMRIRRIDVIPAN